MNKKIYLWLLLLPLAISTMSSCRKLLEIEETDFIGGATALRTVQNNQSLLIGAYAALSLGANDNGTTEANDMPIMLNGVFSDELRSGTFYVANTTHEWQFAPDDVGIRDNYRATVVYYRVIDRVNRVLQALPEAIAEEEADEALRNQIMGEALFLRAFAHFELFRFYCNNYDPNGLGMAYVEEPTLEGMSRISMGEYFQFLLRDLETSKSLVPNNLSDIYRTNRLAVTGLQARVALYTRQWEDAVTYSSEFIEAIPLSARTEFDGIWRDDNNNELAWKLSRVNTNRMGSFYRGLFVRNSAGNLEAPSISWIPSSKLWEAFDQDNDIRFSSYLIYEPVVANLTPVYGRLVHKYAGSGYATNNENVADIKIFRTGEMYLIRAEARAELGSFAGANSAESDLNALRAARITGYSNESFPSQQAVTDAIIEERFKELAFEGHRFWDLRRWGLPVERLAADAPSTQGTTLPAGNFRFLLPIPQSERLANPDMQQNPGYTE